MTKQRANQQLMSKESSPMTYEEAIKLAERISAIHILTKDCELTIKDLNLIDHFQRAHPDRMDEKTPVDGRTRREIMDVRREHLSNLEQALRILTSGVK